MNKAEITEKLIKELQNEAEAYNKTLYIANVHGQNLEIYNKDEYAGVDFWNDLRPHFSKLTKFERIEIHNTPLKGDIYSDLADIKHVKELNFHGTDIRKTEKYINDGLKKFQELETLWLSGAKLSLFPKSIFDIDSLQHLALTGNKFYQQNFHLRLKKNNIDIIDKIKRAEGDDIFRFKEYKWGLHDETYNCIIIRDVYINSSLEIPSVSLYVLNEQKRYEVFTNYMAFFNEIDNRWRCFQRKRVSGKNKPDIFFYFGDDYFQGQEVDFHKLKQLQKNGVPKYEGIGFVNDLLVYAGGDELIAEIENEQLNEELEKSKSFYEHNRWIQQISIENFKLFDKFSLKNLDDINIVVGKNGAGKTSLLQAIAASLIPHNATDIGVHSRFLNIRLNKKPYTSRFARTDVQWESFEKRQRIFNNEIQLEAVKGVENDLPQSFLVLAYGENLYAHEHPFEKEETLSYLDVLVKGNYRSYHTESIFVTAYNKMPNPLDLLKSLSKAEVPSKYEAQKGELLRLGDFIRRKLNHFLKVSAIQQIQIKKRGDFYKFIDYKGHNLDFEQISEGYRSYIILLTDIILRIMAARKKLVVYDNEDENLDGIFQKIKGAIIIDEFDKHMHPTWQRTFLKSLKSEFPQIQFFLSTHNIVSLQAAEGEKVFVLSMDDKGKIVIQENKIPVGYTIEAIYREYFDTHFFSEEISKQIDQLKEWRNKMLKTKDFSDLENPDFIQLVEKLQSISSQTAMIVNIELNQLYQQKQNAETE